MTNLMCGVSSCAHYKDSLCMLGNIQVGGTSATMPRETCCESFAAQGSGHATSAMGGSAAMGTQIRCEAAQCTFNESGACGATTITVAGAGAQRHDETECASFEQRN